MKKILVLATMLLSFGIYGYCQTNIVGTPTKVTTSGQGEKFHNDILPVYDATQDIGSSSTRFLTVYSSGIGGGIAQQATWIDLAAASSATIWRVTATTATFLSSVVVLGAMTQPVDPRNLEVKFFFDRNTYGITLSTLVYSGNCVIDGIDAKGITVQETIVSTNAAGASGNVGNIAFAYISTITIAVTTGNKLGTGATTKDNVDVLTNGITFVVGTSTGIGIPGDINYPSDMIHVVDNGADSRTYKVDTLYDKIWFATNPNASVDYRIYYLNKNIP